MNISHPWLIFDSLEHELYLPIAYIDDEIPA